jgi:nucleoside-diphosphate-sugar epimerase
LTNNFICDINVFNFASQCEKLKNLVYASSSEIVADDPTSPVPENADVLIKNIHNPRWSYRLAKITSENFLTNSNLPWLILRYFNVYGKNSKQGHFLGDQINKIQNGTFSVIGANETRSFCYVSDAISASIHVAQNVSREVINIGNDAEVRIGDAVKIIAKHLGYPDAVFEELPSVQGSVANRRPDISKLRKYMPSYNPISFDEGVEKIV